MATGRDKMGRPLVVVTGLGIVTSLGAGKTDNWAKLTAGESGIKAITRFPTDGLKTRIAGTIDYLPPQANAAALTESFAQLAAEEAIVQSELGKPGQFPGPLFLAVPPIELDWPQRLEVGAKSGANDKVTYSDMWRVSAEFPAYHRRFLLGVEAIRRGETDAALCIGTDGSINPEAVIRFSLLSALSTSNDVPQTAAKPFSKNRDGFVMAEGAGALVLESYDAAKARGAKILGVLEGCGEMTDAFHRTRSSPDGKPIIGCIANAIGDASLTPNDIDYINAHGTSTPENDKMEYLGSATVFGERMKSLPISSNKSMIGHTLSAAGAVEAVFTLLTLQQQRIPPTINYAIPDPAIPLDVVPNRARDASLRHAISNSFGFGGQNVSLVMGLEPA